MALKLIWTPEANSGFNDIVEYLELHFTEKEVQTFVRQVSEFFESLTEYPTLLQSTQELVGIRRGPINKFTVLTYKLDEEKKVITLLSIRAARQKPE